MIEYTPGRRYCIVRIRHGQPPERIDIGYEVFLRKLDQQLRQAHAHLNTRLGQMSAKKRKEREDALRELTQ